MERSDINPTWEANNDVHYDALYDVADDERGAFNQYLMGALKSNVDPVIWSACVRVAIDCTNQARAGR